MRTGIGREMMRLFSSRHESIIADPRGRAARFEQKHGHAPRRAAQRELAQVSNFARPEAGRAR